MSTFRMQKQVALAAGAGALLLVVGILAFNGPKGEEMVKEDMAKDAMVKDVMKKDEMVKDDMATDTLVKDEMVKDDMATDTMVKDEMVKDEMVKEEMMKGSYEQYSPEKIARAAQGDVVLFFHAAWCPSCRALNSSIEQSTGSITKGLSILKVDYDKETELKKKYGVTTQHTLVQVDKDGNLITKWSGGSSLDSVLSKVK